jgi:hypothetical protein
MISTDEGIQMDESDEQSRNADFSIRESLESVSKRTFERFRDPAKQATPMISTKEGIQIDESDEHPWNAHSSILES